MWVQGLARQRLHGTDICREQATKSKLEDCLAALFAEETLDGDNK